MNKSRIQGELRYLQSIYLNLIKLDKKLKRKIRDFSNFRKRTPRRIHRLKNHSRNAQISICGEIKEQKLERKIDREERKLRNYLKFD